MFDVGFWELILIGLIALVVLGPKRLPEAARTAGQWLGKARRFIADVKQDVKQELHGADLAEFRRLQEQLAQTKQMLRESSDEFVRDFNTGLKGLEDSATGDGGDESPAAADRALTRDDKETDARRRRGAGTKKKAARKSAKKAGVKKKVKKKAPARKKKKAAGKTGKRRTGAGSTARKQGGG